MKEKTPFEAWFGFKCFVANLNIFVCICYAHISTVKKEKFEKKVQPRTFVGYSSNKKNYRMFDPSSSKLIASKDVVFDENVAWNWERSKP